VGIEIADLVLPTATGGVSPYTYTLSPETLPQGLSFDQNTRTIRGTPTNITTRQPFTWTVIDAMGIERAIDFSMEVYRIMFAAPVANQSYDRGQEIDPLVLPEVTGGVAPIDYTINLLSLPSGLRYDASTHTILGIPNQITPPVHLTYTATDANRAQDSLTFTLEVVSPVHREHRQALPQQLTVHANYPNPFTHSTRIMFDLPWPAQVQVEVMDLTGRRVYAMSAVHLSSGVHQAIELHDLTLPAGVYLYRLVAMSLNKPQLLSTHVGPLISRR